MLPRTGANVSRPLTHVRLNMIRRMKEALAHERLPYVDTGLRLRSKAPRPGRSVYEAGSGAGKSEGDAG